MKRSNIELLIQNAVVLSGADFRTMKRHMSKLSSFKKGFSEEQTVYMMNAQSSGNDKNYTLLKMAESLKTLSEVNFDVFVQVLELIAAERKKLQVTQKRFDESHYKAKRALYARRWRAKKAGRPDYDDPKNALEKIIRERRCVDAGLPKPKSLTHAQKMRAELDAYIAEEERQHGTGNVSDPRNNKTESVD